MAQTIYHTITLRPGEHGSTRVTYGRLDPASSRMVFEAVADMLGHPSNRVEAMEMLAAGALHLLGQYASEDGLDH